MELRAPTLTAHTLVFALMVGLDRIVVKILTIAWPLPVSMEPPVLMAWAHSIVAARLVRPVCYVIWMTPVRRILVMLMLFVIQVPLMAHMPVPVPWVTRVWIAPKILMSAIRVRLVSIMVSV